MIWKLLWVDGIGTLLLRAVWCWVTALVTERPEWLQSMAGFCTVVTALSFPFMLHFASSALSWGVWLIVSAPAIVAIAYIIAPALLRLAAYLFIPPKEKHGQGH